jgi:hypothetical protein
MLVVGAVGSPDNPVSYVSYGGALHGRRDFLDFRVESLDCRDTRGRLTTTEKNNAVLDWFHRRYRHRLYRRRKMADVGTESRDCLGGDRINPLWVCDCTNRLSGACCRYRANFGGCKTMKSLKSLVIAGALSFGMVAAALAQGFTLPNNSVAQGHLLASPVPGAAGLPVGASCTIAAGSSDSIGACTTTNAFTVSATAITLGTVTSAHLLQWICIGNVGG